MEDHHIAWLSRHPERTEDWLKERLRDGFDVHHIDGDHANNDPGNLVLVEHLDHMRVLHGASDKVDRVRLRRVRPGRAKKTRVFAPAPKSYHRDRVKRRTEMLDRLSSAWDAEVQ